MLVVFRAGPKGDQTLDVIDVIPREKEAIVRQRGLGKKAGRFFWVEVDDAELDYDAFNVMAHELISPEVESIAVTDDDLLLKRIKTRVVYKRRYRLDQKRLQKLDNRFKASTATRTHDASKLFPERTLTIAQLRSVIKRKKTGRFLDGD